MAHWLVFSAEPLPASLAAALAKAGSGPAVEHVLELRRDVIASDPDWTSMTLLPRPDDARSDRYLALVFASPPPPEQVRDLRYVAARNQLVLTEYPDGPVEAG